MTPEERAHDAYTLIMRTLNDTEVQHAIEHQIYHAIRAAVVAERERCAKIAEVMGNSMEAKNANRFVLADEIAAAIRAEVRTQ